MCVGSTIFPSLPPLPLLCCSIGVWAVGQLTMESQPSEALTLSRTSLPFCCSLDTWAMGQLKNGPTVTHGGKALACTRDSLPTGSQERWVMLPPGGVSLLHCLPLPLKRAQCSADPSGAPEDTGLIEEEQGSRTVSQKFGFPWTKKTASCIDAFDSR